MPVVTRCNRHYGYVQHIYTMHRHSASTVHSSFKLREGPGIIRVLAFLVPVTGSLSF